MTRAGGEWVWQLETARGWWLLLRDVLLFMLGAVVWINELLLTPTGPNLEALMAGAAAMSLPFALRQDARS